jgi:hypothetical protein
MGLRQLLGAALGKALWSGKAWWWVPEELLLGKGW